MKEKILVFIGFVAIAVFAYRDCFGILMPAGAYDVFYVFEKEGYKGIFHIHCGTLLSHLFTSLLYVLYYIYGAKSYLWITTCLLLHVIVSFQVYVLFSNILDAYQVQKARLISFFSGLFFLLSPFQTEIVLWNGLGQLTATIWMLSGLMAVIKYLKEGSLPSLVAVHIFFILGLLTFEFSLVFPFLCLPFYLFLRKQFTNPIPFRDILIRIIFPQVLLIFLYFLSSKLLIGAWIPHYGAAVHLKFSPVLILGNYIKYFAQFILFYRYVPKEIPSFLHNELHLNLNSPSFIWTFTLLAAIGIGIAVVYLRKTIAGRQQLLLMLFLCLCISLLPVINLETTFLGGIYTDRYSYFSLAIYYMILSFAIYQVFGKLRYLLWSLIAGLCWLLLSHTIPIWIKASNQCAALIENFSPYADRAPVYILNLPDNYKWAITFRSGFSEGIYFRFHKKNPVNIIACDFNSDIGDSVQVEQMSDTSLLVRSPGNVQTFLNNGAWARSYETGDYRVAFNGEASSYVLTYKKKIPADAVILYAAGDQWREVKLKPY